ncbi:hypothetical protein CBL_20355 [Carabus blaptoides fortunei]
MVDLLQELEESPDEYKNEWDLIKSTVITLEPAKEATIRLQKQAICMGDFYGIWWKCRKATEKFDTPLGRSLITGMDSRQSALLNNNVLLSALYLDPRYQCVLNSANKHSTKVHLKKDPYTTAVSSRGPRFQEQCNKNVEIICILLETVAILFGHTY